MTKLDASVRLSDPDGVYRSLIEAHRGLSADASAELNTRLVLILANQIGDGAIIRQAIELAQRTGAKRTAPLG